MSKTPRSSFIFHLSYSTPPQSCVLSVNPCIQDCCVREFILWIRITLIYWQVYCEPLAVLLFYLKFLFRWLLFLTAVQIHSIIFAQNLFCSQLRTLIVQCLALGQVLVPWLPEKVSHNTVYGSHESSVHLQVFWIHHDAERRVSDTIRLSSFSFNYRPPLGASRVVKQKSALRQLLAHNEMNTILSSVIIGGVYASEKTSSAFYFSERGGSI